VEKKQKILIFDARPEFAVKIDYKDHFGAYLKKVEK
jgi:hypothetical protein